jgi:hypothetical protein
MEHGLQPNAQMPAGVHELFEPIIVTGDGANLSGTLDDRRPLTIIRRGRRADGALYEGPLILIEDARNAAIHNLVIEGRRFESIDGDYVDQRHPLTSDRTSPLFLCSQRLGAPECYDPRHFIARVEGDISIVRSSDVEVTNVFCNDSIKFGIGIGHGCARIRLYNFEIRRAGDYGLWIGAGVEPTVKRLPLDSKFQVQMPDDILLENGFVERCGSAGIFIEGYNVNLGNVKLLANNWDCPYNDESGQLTIDYKADGVRVRGCEIFGGPEILRSRPDGVEVVIGTFGVEACGSNLWFEDTIVEGNSRDAVQILGARGVRFSGRTRLINNHLAQHRHPSFPGHRERQNISITTNAAFAALNVLADDVTLDNVVCENGIIIWSDGSAPDWALDRLVVRNCDLSGPDYSGVAVGTDNLGRSLQGSSWLIE